MQTRRSFLKILAQAGASLGSAPFSLAGELTGERASEHANKERVLVNDIHSQLNPTYVREVVHVDGHDGKAHGTSDQYCWRPAFYGRAAVRDRYPAPRHPAHEQGAQLRCHAMFA